MALIAADSDHDGPIEGQLTQQFAIMRRNGTITPEQVAFLIERFVDAQTYAGQIELFEHIRTLYLESEGVFKEQVSSALDALTTKFEEQVDQYRQYSDGRLEDALRASEFVRARLEGVAFDAARAAHAFHDELLHADALQRARTDLVETTLRSSQDLLRRDLSSTQELISSAVKSTHEQLRFANQAERARSEGRIDVVEAALKTTQDQLWEDVNLLRGTVVTQHAETLQRCSDLLSRIKMAEAQLADIGSPQGRIADLAAELKNDIRDAERRINDKINEVAKTQAAFRDVSAGRSLDDKLQRLRTSIERERAKRETEFASDVRGRFDDMMDQFRDEMAADWADDLAAIRRQVDDVKRSSENGTSRIRMIEDELSTIKKLMQRSVDEAESIRRALAENSALVAKLTDAIASQSGEHNKLHQRVDALSQQHKLAVDNFDQRIARTEVPTGSRIQIPQEFYVKRSPEAKNPHKLPEPKTTNIIERTALEMRLEALEAQLRDKGEAESISTSSLSKNKGKAEDFLKQLRDGSKRREELVEVDSDDDDDAATDPSDQESVGWTLAKMSKAEKAVPYDRKHLCLVSFSSVPIDEFISRWRERFRRLTKSQAQGNEADALLARLTSSHRMAASTGDAKTMRAFYLAIKSHRETIIDVIKAELRWRGAGLSTLDAVPLVMEKAMETRRKKPVNIDDLIAKAARHTEPRALQEHRKVGRRPGRVPERSPVQQQPNRSSSATTRPRQ